MIFKNPSLHNRRTAGLFLSLFFLANSLMADWASAALIPLSPRHFNVSLFQDVHSQLEAQTNLKENLLKLADRFPRALRVGIEGAQGPFHFEPYWAFPDQQLTLRVAEQLLTESLITGPILAGVSGQKVSLTGIENKSLYVKNVEAYRESLASQKKIQEKLKNEIKKLTEAKSRLFSGPLLAYDRANESYRSGDISLGDYLESLVPLLSSPVFSLDAFVEARQMEKSIDFKSVEQAKHRFAEDLAQRLSPADVLRLKLTSQKLEAETSLEDERFQFFLSLGKSKGLTLARYAVLDDYWRYRQLARTLNPDLLFSDLRKAEAGLEENFISQNPRVKKLLELSRQNSLFLKLVRFELTPAEWAECKTLTLSDEDLKPYFRFYETAEKRNEVMAESILQNKLDAVVVGGFHAPGLKAILESRGGAVSVIRPLLTHVDPSQTSSYLSVFAQKKTPLEWLFSRDRLFLAPPAGFGTERMIQVDQPDPNVRFAQSYLNKISPRYSKQAHVAARRLLAHTWFSETVATSAVMVWGWAADHTGLIIIGTLLSAFVLPFVHPQDWKQGSQERPSLFSKRLRWSLFFTRQYLFPALAIRVFFGPIGYELAVGLLLVPLTWHYLNQKSFDPDSVFAGGRRLFQRLGLPALAMNINGPHPIPRGLESLEKHFELKMTSALSQWKLQGTPSGVEDSVSAVWKEVWPYLNQGTPEEIQAVGVGLVRGYQQATLNIEQIPIRAFDDFSHSIRAGLKLTNPQARKRPVLMMLTVYNHLASRQLGREYDQVWQTQFTKALTISIDTLFKAELQAWNAKPLQNSMEADGISNLLIYFEILLKDNPALSEKLAELFAALIFKSNLSKEKLLYRVGKDVGASLHEGLTDSLAEIGTAGAPGEAEVITSVALAKSLGAQIVGENAKTTSYSSLISKIYSSLVDAYGRVKNRDMALTIRQGVAQSYRYGMHMEVGYAIERWREGQSQPNRSAEVFIPFTKIFQQLRDLFAENSPVSTDELLMQGWTERLMQENLTNEEWNQLVQLTMFAGMKIWVDSGFKSKKFADFFANLFMRLAHEPTLSRHQKAIQEGLNSGFESGLTEAIRARIVPSHLRPPSTEVPATSFFPAIRELSEFLSRWKLDGNRLVKSLANAYSGDQKSAAELKVRATQDYLKAMEEFALNPNLHEAMLRMDEIYCQIMDQARLGDANSQQRAEAIQEARSESINKILLMHDAQLRQWADAEKINHENSAQTFSGKDLNRVFAALNLLRRRSGSLPAPSTYGEFVLGSSLSDSEKAQLPGHLVMVSVVDMMHLYEQDADVSGWNQFVFNPMIESFIEMADKKKTAGGEFLPLVYTGLYQAFQLLMSRVQDESFISIRERYRPALVLLCEATLNRKEFEWAGLFGNLALSRTSIAPNLALLRKTTDLMSRIHREQKRGEIEDLPLTYLYQTLSEGSHPVSVWVDFVTRIFSLSKGLFENRFYQSSRSYLIFLKALFNKYPLVRQRLDPVFLKELELAFIGLSILTSHDLVEISEMTSQFQSALRDINIKQDESPFISSLKLKVYMHAARTGQNSVVDSFEHLEIPPANSPALKSNLYLKLRARWFYGMTLKKFGPETEPDQEVNRTAYQTHLDAHHIENLAIASNMDFSLRILEAIFPALGNHWEEVFKKLEKITAELNANHPGQTGLDGFDSESVIRIVKILMAEALLHGPEHPDRAKQSANLLMEAFQGLTFDIRLSEQMFSDLMVLDGRIFKPVVDGLLSDVSGRSLPIRNKILMHRWFNFYDKGYQPPAAYLNRMRSEWKGLTAPETGINFKGMPIWPGNDVIDQTYIQAFELSERDISDLMPEVLAEDSVTVKVGKHMEGVASYRAWAAAFSLAGWAPHAVALLVTGAKKMEEIAKKIRGTSSPMGTHDMLRVSFPYKGSPKLAVEQGLAIFDADNMSQFVPILSYFLSAASFLHSEKVWSGRHSPAEVANQSLSLLEKIVQNSAFSDLTPVIFGIMSRLKSLQGAAQSSILDLVDRVTSPASVTNMDSWDRRPDHMIDTLRFIATHRGRSWEDRHAAAQRTLMAAQWWKSDEDVIGDAWIIDLGLTDPQKNRALLVKLSEFSSRVLDRAEKHESMPLLLEFGLPMALAELAFELGFETPEGQKTEEYLSRFDSFVGGTGEDTMGLVREYLRAKKSQDFSAFLSWLNRDDNLPHYSLERRHLWRMAAAAHLGQADLAQEELRKVMQSQDPIFHDNYLVQEMAEMVIFSPFLRTGFLRTAKKILDPFEASQWKEASSQNELRRILLTASSLGDNEVMFLMENQNGNFLLRNLISGPEGLIAQMAPSLTAEEKELRIRTKEQQESRRRSEELRKEQMRRAYESALDLYNNWEFEKCIRVLLSIPEGERSVPCRTLLHFSETLKQIWDGYMAGTLSSDRKTVRALRELTEATYEGNANAMMRMPKNLWTRLMTVRVLERDFNRRKIGPKSVVDQLNKLNISIPDARVLRLHAKAVDAIASSASYFSQAQSKLNELDKRLEAINISQTMLVADRNRRRPQTAYDERTLEELSDSWNEIVSLLETALKLNGEDAALLDWIYTNAETWVNRGAEAIRHRKFGLYSCRTSQSIDLLSLFKNLRLGTEFKPLTPVDDLMIRARGLDTLKDMLRHIAMLRTKVEADSYLAGGASGKTLTAKTVTLHFDNSYYNDRTEQVIVADVYFIRQKPISAGSRQARRFEPSPDSEPAVEKVYVIKDGRLQEEFKHLMADAPSSYAIRWTDSNQAGERLHVGSTYLGVDDRGKGLVFDVDEGNARQIIADRKFLKQGQMRWVEDRQALGQISVLEPLAARLETKLGSRDLSLGLEVYDYLFGFQKQNWENSTRSVSYFNPLLESDPHQKILIESIMDPELHAALIWGPPGSGKTEIKKELARQFTAPRKFMKGDIVVSLSQSNDGLDEFGTRIKDSIPFVRAAASDRRVHPSLLDNHTRRLDNLMLCILNHHKSDQGFVYLSTNNGLLFDRHLFSLLHQYLTGTPVKEIHTEYRMWRARVMPLGIPMPEALLEFEKLTDWENSRPIIRPVVMQEEGSLATLGESLTPLVHLNPKKYLTFGDHHQLPAHGMADDDIEKIWRAVQQGMVPMAGTFESIFNPDSIQNFKVSLYERALNRSQSGSGLPTFMLRTGRRGHWALTMLFNQLFYKGQLKHRNEGPDKRPFIDWEPLSNRVITIIDMDQKIRKAREQKVGSESVLGVEEGASWQNFEEAGEIVRSITEDLNQGFEKKNFIVTSPYKGQNALIKETLQITAVLNDYAKGEIIDPEEMAWLKATLRKHVERFQVWVGPLHVNPQYGLNPRKIFELLDEMEADQGGEAEDTVLFIKGLLKPLYDITVRSANGKPLRRLSRGDVPSIKFVDPAVEGEMPVIEPATIDSIQGHENLVVLVSFTRSNLEGRIGFLSLKTGMKRLNVAISRPKMRLVLIGSFKTLIQGSRRPDGYSAYEELLRIIKEDIFGAAETAYRAAGLPKINWSVLSEAPRSVTPKASLTQAWGLTSGDSLWDRVVMPVVETFIFFSLIGMGISGHDGSLVALGVFIKSVVFPALHWLPARLGFSERRSFQNEWIVSNGLLTSYLLGVGLGWVLGWPMESLTPFMMTVPLMFHLIHNNKDLVSVLSNKMGPASNLEINSVRGLGSVRSERTARQLLDLLPELAPVGTDSAVRRRALSQV